MKIPAFAIGFLSAALLCGPASAVETDFAAGSQALPLQQDGGTARAMSMGSAVVAVPQGSASLLWNPAALSQMSCMEIGLHHNTGLAGLDQEIAIFGMPLGPVRQDGKGGALGGLAVSVGYVNNGSIEGRDANGLPTASYSAADYSGSVGWGMEFLPGLSGGVTLKTDQANFANTNFHDYAADLGVLWNVIPSVNLGLVYSNADLGSNIAGQVASGWRVGAAWNLNQRLLLAASGELQGTIDRIQMGAEYLFGNIEDQVNVLALRAGYVANYPDPQLTGLTGLTLGVGYTLTHSMALDYAMVPSGDLGISHRLSLTFKFNCPEKAEAAAAPAPAPAPLAAAPKRPVVKAIFLEDSHFDFDKSALKPDGMQALRENIELLKENPRDTVRVAGYTSMEGSVEYNQKLSERRAAAVKSYLIEQGIAPDRITTIGYGEKRPAEYESTPAEINTPAAKANMRVLFEVTVK